uniref:Putative secreted protein n=1 Tax=Rhipicephalus microplus TaxID=6941 RepID=A0A6M2D9R6_RHIMP
MFCFFFFFFSLRVKTQTFFCPKKSVMLVFRRTEAIRAVSSLFKTAGCSFAEARGICCMRHWLQSFVVLAIRFFQIAVATYFIHNAPICARFRSVGVIIGRN